MNPANPEEFRAAWESISEIREAFEQDQEDEDRMDNEAVRISDE